MGIGRCGRRRDSSVYRSIYPLLLGPIIALGIVVPVIIYAMSKGFRAYIEAIGLRALTAFHIWRIGAALVFFWYGAHNLLPEAFVRNAGWGDLFTGLCWRLVSRCCPRPAIGTWSSTSSGLPISSWRSEPG